MGKIWGVQPSLYAPLPQNITIFGFEATRRQGEAGRLLGTAWLPKKATEAPGSAGSAGSAKSAENILPTYSTPEITQPHVMSGTYVAILRSKTCEPAEKAMT